MQLALRDRGRSSHYLQQGQQQGQQREDEEHELLFSGPQSPGSPGTPGTPGFAAGGPLSPTVNGLLTATQQQQASQQQTQQNQAASQAQSTLHVLPVCHSWALCSCLLSAKLVLFCMRSCLREGSPLVASALRCSDSQRPRFRPDSLSFASFFIPFCSKWQARTR